MAQQAKRIDDGGRAFPGEADRVLLSADGEFRGVASHYVCPGEPGMSLRDYFAAAAVQGLLADAGTKDTPSSYASGAYAIADAMLAARNRTP